MCFRFFFPHENNTEQSLTFKNAMMFCRRYENLSAPYLIFWCIDYQNKRHWRDCTSVNTEMSALQSWNQLPAASFQMEKKKVIKFPFPSSGLTCTGRPRVNSALLKSCVRNTPAGWRPASPRSESGTNAQGPAAPSETSAQPWPWEQTKAESLAEGQRDFPGSSFKLCPHGTGPRWIPEAGPVLLGGAL